MFKNLTLIFVLCFIGTISIVDAKAEEKELANNPNVSKYTLPSSDNCPTIETLITNREWVEHSGGWNEHLGKKLATHLRLPLKPVKPTISFTLLPIDVDRGMGIHSWQEILWVIHRTNQTNFVGKNGNCHVMGSVAYYVEVKNKNGWPPKIAFQNKPSYEQNWLVNGEIGLIEFRWFDPVENKKHRWFNSNLALLINWVKGESYSPIPLARVINSLD